MEIRIESLLEGARRARGTVVIVDVFRAFTTAAVALAPGGAPNVGTMIDPHQGAEAGPREARPPFPRAGRTRILTA